MPHTPLRAEDSAALGTALAEIHRQQTFATAELLASDLTIAEPFNNFCAAGRDYLQGLQTKTKAALLGEIVAWLEPLEPQLQERMQKAVLLHGDFKSSNLHRCTDGVPLVLDWEFAYAGPALMDVGQILRWGAPAEWRDSFISGYRENGGALEHADLAWAPMLDIVNLGGLFARSGPGSEQRAELEARIRSILDG